MPCGRNEKGCSEAVKPTAGECEMKASGETGEGFCLFVHICFVVFVLERMRSDGWQRPRFQWPSHGLWWLGHLHPTSPDGGHVNSDSCGLVSMSDGRKCALGSGGIQGHSPGEQTGTPVWFRRVLCRYRRSI